MYMCVYIYIYIYVVCSRVQPARPAETCARLLLSGASWNYARSPYQDYPYSTKIP